MGSELAPEDQVGLTGDTPAATDFSNSASTLSLRENGTGQALQSKVVPGDPHRS